MKKHVLILFAAVIFTLTLAGCSSKYDAEDFIGKTSAECRFVNHIGHYY